MEEEYRLHKTHASVDLTATGMGATDNSSVTGMKSPPPEDDGEGSEPVSAIPTIRISTESARTPNPTQSNFPDRVAEEDEDGGDDSPAKTEEIDDEETVLEKPAVVHEKEDVSGAAGVSGDGEEGVSAFSNKRLCERWLGESLSCSVCTVMSDVDG